MRRIWVPIQVRNRLVGQEVGSTWLLSIFRERFDQRRICRVQFQGLRIRPRNQAIVGTPGVKQGIGNRVNLAELGT